MNPTAELLEPEVRELIATSQFGELRDALATLAPADLADLVRELEAEVGVVVFRLLRRDAAAETLAELEPEHQQALIVALGDGKAVRVLEEMGPDDRAALLDELPGEVAERLILQLSPENRRITQQILNYAEESVGRLATPDYVRLRADWTIAQSLEHIRKHGRDAETIHWVFVIDRDGRLIDDLHIRTLLLADPQQTVESLMDGKFVALEATADQEEAVRVMNRYDRTALPVVDSRGHLIGIVTVDDIADVAEEEFTEDVQKLGGMEALDAPYMTTGFLEMLRKRGGWLSGLLAMQVLTIFVMSAFEAQLERAVILALFVPLIISSGGNTGTQAASLLTRALALREVAPSDWSVVARRELLTGLCLGSVLGVLAWGVVVLLHVAGVAEHEHAVRVGFAVGTAIVGIVIWGAVIGAMLPLGLARAGLDPATSSAPLVATLMDVSGLAIYFLVAALMLRGTVL